MDDGRDEAAFETLSQTTRQTREKFTHVIQALGTSDSATIDQGPNEALEDAFDRFQLWVGSVGASIASQRKISLEWRLRDAPEIKERIVELQSDLVEALDDLYAIATGQRDNRIRAADTIDLDPSSDSDAGSVQLHFEVGAINEAQDILNVVLECVKDLLRLSILIRKATPRDRWNRALQMPKDGRLDDRFDIRHVGDKFPKLCRPEHDWLRHRLGRAITQRRQFIRYCRDHKNRMQELDVDDRIPTSSRAENSGFMADNDMAGHSQKLTALTLNPPMTMESTQASTLQVTNLGAILGDEDDDAASVASSVVSSLGPEDESGEMLRLPNLKAVSEGHDEFECPLCFTIQSFRQHRKWKKHAYSDLRPYVCCGGKGECDLELFSSRNTWFTHELENHRYHWICLLCQREPLTSLAQFHSHVRNKHAEIPIGQILEVAQLCKRPLQLIPAIDCHFCDDFEANLRKQGGTAVGAEVIVVPVVIFRRHVAMHLEQLALFSLGPQNQPDEEMRDGSVELRSDGSVNDADMIKHFLNDQEEFEQDNPTPSSPDQGATRAVAETPAVAGVASLATHEATKRRERKKAEKEQQRQEDLTHSTPSYSSPLSATSDHSYIPETDDSAFPPLFQTKLIEPEVISNAFGLEAYQPNHETNRLAPPSRTKSLTAKQRRNAALMRVVGSCNNCKKRKEKCDPGTPCQSCLKHFKGDLTLNLCRHCILADLSRSFLSGRLGWHPTARALDSFVSLNSFNVSTGSTYIIPLCFGFGPLLYLPVHALHQIQDSSALYHRHEIYSWPPSSSPGNVHTDAVLPAILTPNALSTLSVTLDTHLSLLVTSNQHFRSFPLYCSPLRILQEIHVFYCTLPNNSSHSQMLHQALQLLALVHIGGDLTLPVPSAHPILAQLVQETMPFNITEHDITPTPCFIRSQLGSVMPSLAQRLMNNVLSSLDTLLPNQEFRDWPIALALLLVILMTVETVQYHAAKVAYHHAFDSTEANSKEIDDDRTLDDQDIQTMLNFYAACFSGCHARLSPEWEDEGTTALGLRISTNIGMPNPSNISPEDKFIENMREAVKRASLGNYLAEKASAKRVGGDMGFFFDRLVARLLVMEI